MILIVTIPHWMITMLSWIGAICLLSTALIAIWSIITYFQDKRRQNEPPTDTDWTERALDLILDERQDALNEGYVRRDDDWYKKGELARAAACYLLAPAMQDSARTGDACPIEWPLAPNLWKPNPKDRLRELVKAGQFNLAEIERELRLEYALYRGSLNPDIIHNEPIVDGN